MEEMIERRCPNCGAPLECKLQDFSIGADGGGGLMTLLADQYEVDLFACPQCGKVELYTAGTSRAPRRAYYWCEHCGKEREDRLCPECFQVCDLMEDHLRKQAKKASGQAASDTSEPAQEANPDESHGFRFPWQKREKPPWEG